MVRLYLNLVDYPLLHTLCRPLPPLNSHPHPHTHSHIYIHSHTHTRLIPEGDKLALYYRGFDGAYYKTTQKKAGDAGGKFEYFDRLGDTSDDPNSILE
jgi:hypothetical protein